MTAEPCSSPDSSPAIAPRPAPRRRSRPPTAWLRLRLYLIPIVVFLSLSLPKIHQGEFNVDTGWYAAIAHQAWTDALSGHPASLWTLMGVGGRDGVPYFNKPPLAFWVHGAFLWLFGPTLWAARLPSVLAGVLIIGLLVHAARRTCGPRTAITAGVILATTIEFVRHTHAVSLDLWHALFLFGALAAFAQPSDRTAPQSIPHTPAASRHSPARAAVCSGLFLGGALLTKPLLGLIALPLFLTALLLSGRLRLARWLPLTLAVALVVALPWHLSMTLRHPGAFTGQYLGREIADRAAGESANLNRSAASPFYYAGQLLSHAWPWMATAILALVAILRRQRLSRAAGTPILLAVWIVAWFVLLSLFPDKRPRYLLPLYAPAAWLSAQWACAVAPRIVRRVIAAIVRRSAPAAAFVGVALSLAPVTLHAPQSPTWDRFFSVLREHPDRPLHQGGFIGSRAARVYLLTGRWPIPTHDTSGALLPGRSPPIGALIAYHSRDGLTPGATETTVFHEGELTITTLDSLPWSPLPAAPE